MKRMYGLFRRPRDAKGKRWERVGCYIGSRDAVCRAAQSILIGAAMGSGPDEYRVRPLPKVKMKKDGCLLSFEHSPRFRCKKCGYVGSEMKD